MEFYKKFEIDNNTEYKYDYNFGNNLENIKIKEEYERKFDMLLDGIISDNKKKIDELN